MKKMHTYAICAYGDSRYLETCIRSLKRQTVGSGIIMCTSTPSDYIKGLAEVYDIPLFVREGKSDIRADWNFAYDSAATKYVTIAHQDDVYHREYTRAMLKAFSRHENAQCFFTGYRPFKEGHISIDANCVIRAALRFSMRFDVFAANTFAKKAILSLGNSICCPTVTYNKEILGKHLFTSKYKYNIDWDTMYKLARQKGSFLYDHRALVAYRIHDGATSKEYIDNSGRYAEDLAMFERFWGKGIAKLIMKAYVLAYRTYE